MRGSTKAFLTAATLVIAAAGVAVYSFTRPVELPEPGVRVHREVFPELDFDAAAPGSSVARIFRAFGKQGAGTTASSSGRRCIYFVYDPELFEGALVVLAHAELVEKRWVVNASVKPEECAGLSEERIALSGWYAAATQ
jgi:hypothetical protein